MKKNRCCECEKETTDLCYILTGKNFTYEAYCLQCARVFFSHVGNGNQTQRLNLNNLNNFSYQYDMLVQENSQKLRKEGIVWREVPSMMKELVKRKANGEKVDFNKIVEEHSR